MDLYHGVVCVCCCVVLFTHDIMYDLGILFHEKLRRQGVHTGLYIAPGMSACDCVLSPLQARMIGACVFFLRF